jgi:hypothetical protein
LQLAVDGGRLKVLGAQEVPAITAKIDGRDAAQVARLAAGLSFEPDAQSAEIVEIPAGCDRGETPLAKRAPKSVE